ncbi:MAG: squalene--hopene cyclase [Candidatus Hydrogenedentes bacterium]|nr:squalene--hopene cyclase [Candidatus Hydrogenedentota bacterium]
MAVTAANQMGSALLPLGDTINAGVKTAIEATQAFLLSQQHADGHWCAELEGDTILESEYILTMHYIGRTQEDRVRKAANYLRRQALREGGWSIYPDGPADVSASAKAYFTLKLLGDSENAPHMVKAREVIRKLGGLDATNSFTRLYLAIFGQYPWEKCPAVPPEILLLPSVAPINLYEMSSWSRGIVVPLSVIWAYKPYCPVPEHANIPELMVENPNEPTRQTGMWPAFFMAIDSTLKAVESSRITPMRAKALRACEKWMIEHFEQSDGIGAIFPPIINSIIALRCLGYPNEHPLTQSQIRELEKLEIEEGETLRVQPCFSPVWDTAYVLHAFVESGMDRSHPELLKASDWLLAKEVRKPGDWKLKNPNAKPGGWYFEYANEFYPDLDDTFEVLTTLRQIHYPDSANEQRKQAALKRGLDWALSMQNVDGGWGAFDRGCDKEYLTQIPFADHNAMIDPSTSDITARGIEALVTMGYSRNHPVMQRALEFVRNQQEADGTWFGRWGVNYIYGTWLALCGLRAAGEDMTSANIQRAAKWLRTVQNSDGGWGESPRSYDDPSQKGKGVSTASQTAWALMGLMATGDYTSPSVLKGITYLLETQNADGTWHEDQWTGTGFPRVFYLHYHYYAIYFPLIALGKFRKFHS